MDDRPEETGKRVAFLLHLRQGMEEAYEESHRHVWPEMLELLSGSGISHYSIFRRDTLLVLTFSIPETETFDQVWSRVEASPVNTRWQQAMAPYFEPLAGMREGERFPMAHEVFYLA